MESSYKASKNPAFLTEGAMLRSVRQLNSMGQGKYIFCWDISSSWDSSTRLREKVESWLFLVGIVLMKTEAQEGVMLTISRLLS
jgi:hypothetical protein